MGDYKVNFREMKSRVGIDDIAYALGYRMDRKAGVGRYIELVLGEGDNRRDTLIVSHPNNKAAQTFFRRDGSRRYPRAYAMSSIPTRDFISLKLTL